MTQDPKGFFSTTMPSPPSYPAEGLLAVLLYELVPKPDLIVEINMGA